MRGMICENSGQACPSGSEGQRKKVYILCVAHQHKVKIFLMYLDPKGWTATK